MINIINVNWVEEEDENRHGILVVHLHLPRVNTRMTPFQSWLHPVSYCRTGSGWTNAQWPTGVVDTMDTTGIMAHGPTGSFVSWSFGSIALSPKWRRFKKLGPTVTQAAAFCLVRTTREGFSEATTGRQQTHTPESAVLCCACRFLVL